MPLSNPWVFRVSKETIAVAQREFTHWADHKKNPERNVKDLLERLTFIIFQAPG